MLRRASMTLPIRSQEFGSIAPPLRLARVVLGFVPRNALAARFASAMLEVVDDNVYRNDNDAGDDRKHQVE